MRQPSLRLGLGVLTLVLAAIAVQPALSNPVDQPWTGSGSGTTTVVSDGSSGPAVFQYQVFGSPSFGVDGSWSFSTTSSSTRTVNLTYDYTGFNAFFKVKVGLEAFVTHGVTTTTTSLVNAGPVDCCTPPSGGFTYTGSVTLSVEAGDTYGFMLQGSNRDRNATLQGTLTVDEPCTQTVTGTVPGPLDIGPGVTCITGGTVAGPVSVSAGAALRLTDATIYGPLTANGAAQVAVCDSTIAGPVSVSGSSGSVLIGSADAGRTPACGGNVIMGPVTLTGNSGGAELGANTIYGQVTLTGNGGPAAVVAANTIAGPLSCAANGADPTDNGKPNTVQGPAVGQCAALG
jgi:hypothetical protein